MAASLSTVPKLYIWQKRSLYLGVAYVPLRDYTVAGDQLVVCLQGEIVFSLPDGSTRACRSILLRAGTKVELEHVDTSNAIIGICYLNPIGQDYRALLQMMREELEGVHIDHAEEAELIRQLRNIRDSRLGSKQAYSVLTELVLPARFAEREFKQYDPRIVKVIHRITETIADNVSISSLAAEVHLSESRLVKLFKTQIGIPITKHRIRQRVFVGVIHLAVGYSITDAALAAGFSSTSHFSKCFRAIIGTQPSSTFLSPPYVDIILADECRKAISR